MTFYHNNSLGLHINIFFIVKSGLTSAFSQVNEQFKNTIIVAKIDIATEHIFQVQQNEFMISSQDSNDQLQSLAEMHSPCFLLHCHQAKDWRLYTYCPDSESVRFQFSFYQIFRISTIFSRCYSVQSEDAIFQHETESFGGARKGSLHS